MHCYATLFVNWLLADSGYFEELLKKRLWPEVGLQHGGFGLSLQGHKEVSARIKDAGLRCSIHLPFEGVRAGSSDRERWRRGRDILLKALEIAAVYEPDHLIGHPEFRPGLDSSNSVRGLDGRGGISKNLPSELWLDRSAETWSKVLEASPARLYLENTSDLSADALMALLEKLPERAAFCFDIGHWHYAAEGSVRRNLPQWIEAIAPRLGHLHLHDNDGGSDQHRGLGLGGIDFDAFWDLLAGKNLRPTFTLEAHHLSDLEQSLRRLAQLPAGSPLEKAL